MSKNKPHYNDNTKLNTRSYSWDLIIYEISKEYLQKKLDELINRGLLRRYAYIIHDKDKQIDENNIEVDKPIHCHLLVVFTQNVSVKQIKERLLEYTEHNTFGQPLKDKRGAYRYLTHKDNPEKYQYNDNEIVNYDDYFQQEDFLINQPKDAVEINQMIDDFSSLSYRQLAIKYGRDFIKNFKAYEYYFKLIIDQEKGEKNEN